MGKGDECVVGWWQQARKKNRAEEAPSNFERRQEAWIGHKSVVEGAGTTPPSPSLVPLSRARKGDWGVVHLCEGVGKGGRRDWK